MFLAVVRVCVAAHRQVMAFKERVVRELLESLQSAREGVELEFLDGKEDLAHGRFLKAFHKADVTKLSKEHGKLLGITQDWAEYARVLGLHEQPEELGNPWCKGCKGCTTSKVGASGGLLSPSRPIPPHFSRLSSPQKRSMWSRPRLRSPRFPISFPAKPSRSSSGARPCPSSGASTHC